MTKNWYNRPVSVVCFFLICLLTGLALLQHIRLGPGGKSHKNIISVIIRHYGIDSAEIERSITIPLEDSLSILPTLEEIQSTSEYGMSRIELSINDKSSESYLFIRDTVDRFYATLPKSVQKPQIVSSSTNQTPVFILAFEPGEAGLAELRDYVEHEIKPSFENLGDVGEVEIGGGELKEIHVLVDTAKMSAVGITFDQLAAFLQSSHLQTPLGRIEDREIDLPVLLKGEMKDINEIRQLKISYGENKYMYLHDLADVRFGYRQQDSISRVDGDQKVILYLKTSGTANIIQVSRQARKETDKWKSRGFDCRIILDSGKEIEESIYSVFQAIGIGIIVVCLVLAPFQRKITNSLLLAFSLPVVTLFTLSVLTAFAISIDRYILAGIAVCIGMVIDSGIVISEQINLKSRETGLKEIISPLVSSTLTTVIVLVPLFFLDEQISGISQISLAIVLIVTLSVLFNLVFLPVFLKRVRHTKTGGEKRVARFTRKIIGMAAFFTRKPLSGLLLGSVLTATGVFVLIIMDKNISSDIQENIIRAHVEFESGASAISIDKRIKPFTSAVLNIPGVERLESNARRDNCQISIICDHGLVDLAPVKKKVKALQDYISGGFLYIPEDSGKDLLSIRISISGTENETLRDLARKTVQKLGEQPWVSQGVLHFKDPPAIYSFSVDQKKAAISGTSAAIISGSLRWALLGPVAVKWQGDGREMDLRIMAKDNTSLALDDLLFLSLPLNEGKTTRLYREGEFETLYQDAKIYRTNRQRSVSLSIQVANSDIFKTYQNIKTVLDSVDLPEGYAFEIDKTIIENQRYFRQLYGILILAVAIIYMLLAAQTESLRIPLMVLSIVPVSLAFPLLALGISGAALTLPAIVGLIILTGMIVNNSILIIDNYENLTRTGKNQKHTVKILLAVKQRLRPLFLTSLTTIAGTLPMFFLHSGGTALLSDLALIMFWGISGSFLMTLTFIPSIIAISRKRRRTGSEKPYVEVR
ncbi:MAG: efflux RND transporter permease subunit [Spirochaetales bacterium]|nr:efflux RND transporter permease subunit [Spirochaetales bacterium]